MNRRLSAAVVVVLLPATNAIGQSTVFTYQGRLSSGGTAAMGLHDFRFRLFDMLTDGVQAGPTLCLDNVSVASGVFSVQLDFGPQFVTAGERYLEIEVRQNTGNNCSNATGFVVLAPRQPLTPAPRANHANSAFALAAADGDPAQAVFVDATGRVGIGTSTPQSKVHVTGAPDSIRLDGPAAGAANQAYAAFHGSNGVRSGFVGDGSTGDSSIFVSADTGDVVLETAAGRVLNVTSTGNVGVGTTAPTAKLDVRGDIRLGPTGQLRAASGDENLRIVRGVVNGSGVILNGSGFSAARLGTGRYQITFTSPFLSTPSFTGTGHVVFVNEAPTVVSIVSHSGSQATLSVDLVDGNNVDATFDFIAIGPR